MNKFNQLVAAAVLGVTAPLSVASADENTVPLPALTAQWWQWAVSIPVDRNPQSDPTGQDCMIGQRGNLWFLAGVFSGGPAQRSCSVPEGKTLFFPIINEIDLAVPGECGDTGEFDSIKDLRQATKAFVDAVPLSSLKVRVDGKPVPFRRVRSQVFAVALPVENEFDAACVARRSRPCSRRNLLARRGRRILRDRSSAEAGRAHDPFSCGATDTARRHRRDLHNQGGSGETEVNCHPR
jgi:hypothetical protein